MKEERILNILGKVDEKYIQEAAPDVKAKRASSAWTKWVAIAACFCFVLFATFALAGLFNKRDVNPGTSPVQSGIDDKNVRPENRNILFVNEVENVTNASMDMDVQFSFYNEISSDERSKVEAEFKKIVGVSYEELTARLPDTLTIDSFYSVNTLTNTSEETYAPHDYVFECRTESGGEVRLAVSSLGPNCRDLYIVVENPAKSQINGIELTIYGWSGMYLIEFFSDGRFYDIETSGFTLEELENLLVNIIDK